MTRPAVDVVVPFAGDKAALVDLVARLSRLRLGPADTVVVVDNTPGGAVTVAADPVRVVHARERPTPGYARNRGAALGSGDWLVFLDADAVPPRDLLDRYFDPPPRTRTALIGGGVIDEVVPADAPAAARYAYLRGVMSQERTFAFGVWGYPKSANVACRRVAFGEIGGFREDIRAAEDADLTYRLRAAGWEVERREDAAIIHLSRRTIRGLLRQQLLWGAGGAWVARVYPGSLQLAGASGLVRWGLPAAIKALIAPIRCPSRDAAIYALLRPLEALAWEVGRLLSNERPAHRPRVWNRLHR